MPSYQELEGWLHQALPAAEHKAVPELFDQLERAYAQHIGR
jgi:hypothetical protein